MHPGLFPHQTLNINFKRQLGSEGVGSGGQGGRLACRAQKILLLAMAQVLQIPQSTVHLGPQKRHPTFLPQEREMPEAAHDSEP